MKKFLLFIIFSVFISTQGFSQSCANDSVVGKTYFENDNGDLTRTISIDSFDLTNGKVYSTFIDLINNPIPVRTNGNFVRRLLSYNANSDTLEYREALGTGTGYTDVRKIEFNYNLNNKLLSRVDSRWNGSAWMIAISEVWTINGSGHILNYLVSDSTGNILQKNYSYSGNQQVSVLLQNYISGNWLNVEQFLITYLPSGNRDSLYLQKWDTSLNLWIDSLEGSYNQTTYLADLVRYMYFPGDTITYSVDSLNNVVRMVHQMLMSNQTVETTTWNYFHENLKLVSFHVSAAYSYSENYTYDTAGILLRRNTSSNSPTSSSGSNDTYDSLGNPLEYRSSFGSGASDRNSKATFTYSTDNGLALAYIPVEDYTLLTCQADSTFSIPLISGACGPYTINWSPSIGLSSDTVPNPTITFQDSISYTITITDSIGQSASTIFTVEPDYKLSISFDTTLCPGCPVMLSATSGYSNYKWYRNDTLISQGQNFLAIESGIYRVEASGYCDLSSNSVVLTLSGLTRIRGHVYLDMDSDCVFNNADLNLVRYGTTPFLIQLQRQNYSALINTDSAGYYDIPIDTGNFRISVINPSNIFMYSCPDSGVVHVYVPAYGDTVTGIDFGLKIKYTCNRMSISISSSRLRPCSNETINVSYFNEGSVDENNPIVNLRLPPELINITSSETFTVLPDNTYQFSLPPLGILGIGNFSLSADVICDPTGLQGATLCIDAEITPINFCSLEPDSAWDGSYIRVYSSCENDSACFTIHNYANPGSDMDMPSVWKLYADNLLIQQGTFQLQSGEDTALCFSSDGRTYRLEADQTDSFPTTGIPDANVERCGVLQSGSNYSLNYILQSPRNNSLPFQKTYCAPVFNSYDPNTKSVSPTGYGSRRIFHPDERITYRIDFQNTGNDTAYIVKITDDITFHFDRTTIQIISSSHPYSFSIENHKMTWLFDQILLPDSNVDETNSHGYVEFSIKVKSSTPQGTLVSNTANIYFDFNSPIYANSPWVKICTPESPTISISQISDFCAGNVTIGSALQYPGNSPIIKWYINGIYFPFNGDTITLSGLNLNDQIQAKLWSSSPCSIFDSVSSNFVLLSNSLPTINYSWPELVSSPGTAYQWYLDSVMISGAINQTYIPLASGNYQVQVTDTAGCSQLSPDFPFVFTGLSNQKSENLKVYPNPSRGKFRVDTTPGNKIISIKDLTNQSILNFTTSENSIFINLPENISSGVYYLIVRNGEEISYERIIVQP